MCMKSQLTMEIMPLNACKSNDDLMLHVSSLQFNFIYSYALRLYGALHVNKLYICSYLECPHPKLNVIYDGINDMAIRDS